MSAVWPVLVEDWQLDCCGEPFAVGERVRWTLALVPAPRGLERFAVELAGADVSRVERSDGGRERVDLQLGALRVGWDGPRPEPGRARRGLLTEDHHGEVKTAATPTEGVVRCIRRLDDALLVDLEVDA